MSHVLLGVPTSRLHPSPRSAGPVFASHFYDLQIPTVPNYLTPLVFDSAPAERAHTGPPAVNIEIKLAGEMIELEMEEGGEGDTLEGGLFGGGPGLLQLANGDSFAANRQVAPHSSLHLRLRLTIRWVNFGEVARVQTNGTFIIGPGRDAS